MSSLLASIREHIRYHWFSVIHSGLPLFFWVRPRWKLIDVPDQTGKIVLVTGGNSGTGYETCKAFYDHGATVYVACRNAEKGKEAIEAMEKGGVRDMYSGEMSFPSDKRRAKSKSSGIGRTKGKLILLKLDLADLDQVEKAAAEVQRRESKIDILIANAGVMACPEGMFTKQGYTLQFGTNCLGHHRLISLLLPQLLQTSKLEPESPARVIILTSTGHGTAPSGGVDFRSVVRQSNHPFKGQSDGIANDHAPNGTPDELPKRGPNELMKWIEYGQSKWGDIALARWLHWAYGPSEGRNKESVDPSLISHEGEIISVAVHPGLVSTNLAQHLTLDPLIRRWCPYLIPMITVTAARGALNQIWASTCPTSVAQTLSGEYVVPAQTIGHARPDLNDREAVEAVWRWCNEQAKRNN